MPTDAAILSDLLDHLYASTVDESRWAVFLDHLCLATGSKAGLLLSNDSLLGNKVLADAPERPRSVDQHYNEGFSYTDPFRQAFMRNPRTGIVEMEDLVPHEEVVHTDSYRYMMQPFGVDYGTFIIPSVSMRTYEFIGVYRQDPPRLPSDTLHLLELLFPHIQNALKIRRTIASVQERLQSAEGMLDLAEEACLLLGTSCHILFANAAAKQLLSNSDGLIVRGDKVTAEDPTQRRALQRLVAAAEDPAEPGGATTIERRNGKRALQVFVMPFRLEAVHRAGARVLLLVSDPDRTVNVPDMILRQLYGLTPAETEVANGLLAGYSLDEIAVLRRVAPSTVRSQMKSLFSKTSTTRQADLVRLLASLPKKAMRANETTTGQQTARRRS